MKKRVITGVVFVVIFIAAAIGFSFMLNKGTKDQTTDIGGAALPLLSFEVEDYKVNELTAYAEEMEITSVRDMVYPVSVGTSVKANISGYTGKIDSAEYEIRTLDGEKCIKEEKIKNIKDSINVELGDTISDGKEKILKVKLNLENDKTAYYYIRIIRAVDFNVHQCLDFANDFHNKTFQKEEAQELKKLLAAESEAPDTSLQKVTLESDIEQISWGGLKPEIAGDVSWQIKESTETYNSITLKYRVKAKGNLYNVTEFLKVRFLKGEASLEDYERTMNQLFSGTGKNFASKGIILGITDENVPYLTNKEEDIISFVQEREVWNYNKKKNEISLVFSFADAENKDIRNYNDNHNIRLIEIDEAGNTTFAVFGYMNRGTHEGRVGVTIYYFDSEENCVEEKAFIPSKKAGEISVKKLDQLVYYSRPQNAVYVMFEGALYKVDLETGEQEMLIQNLKEGQYASSADGKNLAYQFNGTLTEATTMMVWNLQTGKNHQIKVKEGEVIRPLGFVQGDIVYGVGRQQDIGRTVSGETILPLYKLEISNEKNEIVKTYEPSHAYVTNVRVIDNMVEMDRVKKSGNKYSVIQQDYITNNKEQKKQSTQIEVYLSEENSTLQVRLAGEKRIEDTNPKLLKPKQKRSSVKTDIKLNVKDDKEGYYVYGRGKLCGIYDKAGDAIIAADPVKGVVVTSKQTKIWERGNRQLSYNLENAPAFAKKAGENSLTACLEQMLQYAGKNVNVAEEMKNGKSVMEILDKHSGGEALDLTGCTVEELFYIIGKGTPVIAMTGENSAVLLTGYDSTTVTYINPQTGRKPTKTIEAVEEMLKDGQNILIGYAK